MTLALTFLKQLRFRNPIHNQQGRPKVSGFLGLCWTTPKAITMSSRWRTLLCSAFFLAAGGWGLVAALRHQSLSLAETASVAESTRRGDLSPTLKRLNAAFETSWEAGGMRPTPTADDLTLARRLSLALTGTIPSLEEIRAFEAQPGSTRLETWLEHLLKDRRCSDYVAERLARVFVGVEDGPFVLYRRHRLVSWLSDQILANRPYDALVRDMIAAEGIWTSRPQANFITVTVDQNNDKEGPDEQRLAARVSRAFLGVRIDCVQCHDDQFGDRWKQKDFHQLAAFFAPAEISLTGVRDTPGKGYQYRYLHQGQKEKVPQAVPFCQELLPKEGGPRERLATWVTHPENRAFARTLVNRVWALMFSQPLVKPIDSIPLEGPFPPGLEVLVEDVVRHGFDLHRLIRVIALSNPFQRDSRAAQGVDPSAGETGFASFPLSRLRPEQVAGSVLQSSSLVTLDAASHVFTRFMRFQQQSEFVKRYGDIGEDEFEGVAGTLPQRLILMNGKLVHERTKEDLVLNAATRIAAVAPDSRLAVETAFLTTLTRRPTEEEMQHFLKREHPKEGGRARFMEDLCWALINSTEFSWNH